MCRFVRHLGDSEVNLSHFGIGATSMKHIADTLRSNPPLKALVLGDNWLHEDGGLEVAR